ncbi:sensor histidine kinase [Bacillus sp. JCM 19041]|uniref:sensor histidine kinase n=1 Tax=Bacillus sp. JCM 19041 TaxID=1460637 RepID=UPI0006D12356
MASSYVRHFLSLLIFGIYLIVRYYQLKPYYEQLEKQNIQDHDFYIKGTGSIIKAHNQLLNRFYQVHQNEIQTLKANKHQHVKFMTQWVHQMKTPVAVMEMIAEDLPEKVQLENELVRLNKGLQLALHAARFDKFEEDFHIKKVWILPLVRKLIQQNKRLFIHNELYPKIQVNEVAIVHTDPKWLEFMVEQLLVNAIKYSHKQTTVMVRCEGNVLSVIDAGIGIGEEDLPRITRPFYTGNNGRSRGESTGMGLYLVNEIAKKLSMELTFRSTLGEGTAASIILKKAQVPGL